MRLSRIVLLLSALLIVGACAAPGELRCPNRQVNLIANTGGENSPTTLQVRPDTIVIKPGCSFKLRLPAGKTVSTNSAKAWLTKSPQSGTEIEFTAPEDEEEDTYKYSVEVAGFGTLDPRARVRH